MNKIQGAIESGNILMCGAGIPQFVPHMIPIRLGRQRLLN